MKLTDTNRKLKNWKLIVITGALLSSLTNNASAYGAIGFDKLHCWQRPAHIEIEYRDNMQGKQDCYAINRNSGLPAGLVNTIYYNPLPAHGLPERCLTLIQANPGCQNVGNDAIRSMTRYRGGNDSTTQY